MKRYIKLSLDTSKDIFDIRQDIFDSCLTKLGYSPDNAHLISSKEADKFITLFIKMCKSAKIFDEQGWTYSERKFTRKGFTEEELSEFVWEELAKYSDSAWKLLEYNIKPSFDLEKYSNIYTVTDNNRFCKIISLAQAKKRLKAEYDKSLGQFYTAHLYTTIDAYVDNSNNVKLDFTYKYYL